MLKMPSNRVIFGFGEKLISPMILNFVRQSFPSAAQISPSSSAANTRFYFATTRTISRHLFE